MKYLLFSLITLLSAYNLFAPYTVPLRPLRRQNARIWNEEEERYIRQRRLDFGQGDEIGQMTPLEPQTETLKAIGNTTYSIKDTAGRYTVESYQTH